MSEFRYIRMAENDQGWKRPHGGRKGGSDYVGTQGLGHEDWNFAQDVWQDGRYHLYLRSTPANFHEGGFNLVLGAHARPTPLIIGFVENATYGISELPEQALQRRAQEVVALDGEESLGPLYAGKSVEQIAELLRQDASIYRVSIEPQDLHVLVQPAPMPTDIYKVTHPGYRALTMTEKEYRRLREVVLLRDRRSSVVREEDASFPEGLLVQRLHRSRERNRRVVELAKKNFIKKNGRLYCEVCALDPEMHYGSTNMRNRIIEAHHDVALSDDNHRGETKVRNLRMVCPTCHRAIHSIRPWSTVEELRELFKSKR